MKEQLFDYLNNAPRSDYNKNHTRYIYLRKPELWKWILEMTPFLTKSALPKQRIWHIINDKFEIPKCPIDKVPLKWHENRYLSYASRSAKAKSKIVTKKRLDTYRERTGFDHWNSKENTEGYNKLKKTHFKNWGGVWSAAVEEIYIKFIATKIENGGCRTDDEKSDLELYSLLVEDYTDYNWKFFYENINPKNLLRGKDFHLDHIYSRSEGFNNGVPPEVIGHWTNLRMIPASQNVKKWKNCDKTLEELFEDFEMIEYIHMLVY